VLFTLIVGNISGSIIARRSFGGELNVQSAYYILGIMIVFSGFMGFYYVKRDTRQHRKWMLRESDTSTASSCISSTPQAWSYISQ
jgi:hypothetical protein